MALPIELDVHTHFFPPGLGDFAERTGDPRWPSLHHHDAGARIMRGSSVFRPVNETCWNIADRLRALDATEVGHQVLSPVPITLVGWAEPGLAAQFLRAQNDALAEAVATAPDRFSAVGAVPLQDGDRAVAELQRVVQDLGFAGVEIGTTVDGVGDDHVMVGSDFPFYPAGFGGASEIIEAGCALGCCSDAQARAVLGGNAKRFLTRTPLDTV